MGRPYNTWQLPGYVRRYFGHPMELEKIARDKWVISGPNAGMFVEAFTAKGARERIRDNVANTLGLTDARLAKNKPTRREVLARMDEIHQRVIKELAHMDRGALERVLLGYCDLKALDRDFPDRRNEPG